MIDEEKPKAATDFNLVVVSPDKMIFEGTCTKLICPSITQELLILPDHAPLYSLLQKGKLKAHTTKGKIEEFEIEGGILRVRSNKVSIVIGFDVQDEKKK